MTNAFKSQALEPLTPRDPASPRPYPPRLAARAALCSIAAARARCVRGHQPALGLRTREGVRELVEVLHVLLGGLEDADDAALARRQGAWSILGQGGHILRRGHELTQVLRFFDAKRFQVVE